MVTDGYYIPVLLHQQPYRLSPNSLALEELPLGKFLPLLLQSSRPFILLTNSTVLNIGDDICLEILTVIQNLGLGYGLLDPCVRPEYGHDLRLAVWGLMVLLHGIGLPHPFGGLRNAILSPKPWIDAGCSSGSCALDYLRLLNILSVKPIYRLLTGVPASLP